MLSAISESFTPFLIWIPLSSFPSLVALSRTCKPMFNSSGESRQVCLVPGLRECFQFFTIENNVCCRLIIYGLCYVEVDSLNAHVLKNFNHNWVLNFVEGFFCIY